MPRTLALVVVEVVFVSPEEEANKELKKLDILINIVYLDIYMSKSLDLQNQTNELENSGGHEAVVEAWMELGVEEFKELVVFFFPFYFL